MKYKSVTHMVMKLSGFRMKVAWLWRKLTRNNKQERINREIHVALIELVKRIERLEDVYEKEIE